MTTVCSWNIQNGLGVDGVLSLGRIAEDIRSICDPDIVCLQEVSIDMLLRDGSYADQVDELAALFPGYCPVFGAAMDVWMQGQRGRARYGNLILSRYPVQSVFLHSLPQPQDEARKQMPRQLTEVSVTSPSGTLRLMTTHLEFHSEVQRLAQAKRIMEIQADVAALMDTPPLSTKDGPYARFDRPATSLLCGDFNFMPGSQEYLSICEPSNAQPALHDAWLIANPNTAYAPTCGIHDSEQWSEGPHCRDFMFVSADLTGAVRSMFIDEKTAASDHQPLVLELDM